jgi:hypothetical protein
MRKALAVLVVLAAAYSCSPAPKDAEPGGAAADTTVPAMSGGGDPDVAAVGGTGVPSGYIGRTDRADQQLSGAKYAVSGNGWDITTGPAHILYRPGDSASGSYTVTTTIDQLAAPAHPEAYGVFVGGRNLDAPGQRYFYFLVRGTGEFMARVREGDKTRNVLARQKNAAVPTANASGQASYKLAIQVAGDSVRLRVNDQSVATVAATGLPTSGVYGNRINHNLHVKTTPATVTRP